MQTATIYCKLITHRKGAQSGEQEVEYPFILGTAGHIDHGKTALVRAMTGVDCDRLEEEKRRGITIELGFAPLSLSNGKTVSIVDVPGHERFVRQMVAGAAGIDAAMLVIAANEGVMPQTREHLDILNILDVKFGVVVLTKKDLVDGEMLELASAEAADITRGTCLEGAPIISVSAFTGEGIPLVLKEIEKILDKVMPRKGFGAFFLPIDRVFSKKGLGTVITGSAYQGSVAAGEEIEIMPSGITGKVRALQTHGETIAIAPAGQRLAVNLASISQDQLERGDAVCAKGSFVATDCVNAHLDILPSAPKGVAHWQRVRLHIGTADVVARISLLGMSVKKKESEISPGSGGPVQILTESKIIAAAGQRFVIRFYSPLRTIGGGRVMLPNARAAKGRVEREIKAKIIESLKEDFTPVSLLAAIIRDNGVMSVAELFLFSQMEKSIFDENLAKLSAALEAQGILEFGSQRNFISSDAFAAASNSVLCLVQNFHKKFPELSGIEPEKLQTSKELLDLIADKTASINTINIQGKILYKAAEHSQSLDKKFVELLERIQTESLAAGFNLVKISEIEEKLKVMPANMKRALTYLKENEGLGIIEGGLIFPRETREKLIKLLSSMEDITIAALRDAIGVNRKQSLAMLDFLDSQGLTQRDGDKRILRATL